MSEISRPLFVKEYAKALHQGDGALFAGAGMSRSAGFVDWRGLLRDIAKELNLDVDKEHDLIALAQFHKNHVGNRGVINQKLVEEFTKSAEETDNHRLIARLPISTVWTTNYDKLLENAFQNAGRHPEVKHTTKQLAKTAPNSDVTIYKMHGDVDHPDDAVLTKEDYDSYNQSRSFFSDALKGDLISKTFLFLGFSFEDPNIDQILARLWVVLQGQQRRHFCILRRPNRPKHLRGTAKADYEYRKRKLALRVQDLGRYGIHVVLVDDFPEVTSILKEISFRAKAWNVFVSGSADDFGAFGEQRMYELSERLGAELVKKDFVIVSGFGRGIGSSLIAGAVEGCIHRKVSIDRHLHLHPFPQGLAQGRRERIHKTLRSEMIAPCGCAILMAGNKRDGKTGANTAATGMLQEIAIARENGVRLIPIGATGFTAKDEWNRERSMVAKEFHCDFDVLGNQQASNDDLVAAVIRILTKFRDEG